MSYERLAICNRRTGTHHALELRRHAGGAIDVTLDGQPVLDGPLPDWEPEETTGPAFDIWMEWCQRERDFIE